MATAKTPDAPAREPDAPFIIVTNTEPRRRSIANKTGKPLQLKPGANIVPRAAWETAKTHAVVRAWLAEGGLREGGSLPADGLAALSSAAAVELVGEVLDTVALRAWNREEKRPEVQRAIDRQLAKIDEAGRTTRVDQQPWQAGRAQAPASP